MGFFSLYGIFGLLHSICTTPAYCQVPPPPSFSVLDLSICVGSYERSSCTLSVCLQWGTRGGQIGDKAAAGWHEPSASAL